MRQLLSLTITIICIVLLRVDAYPANKASAVEKITYAVASWYGADFHGKETASGEKFDMNGFTCAHKKYPFGTWLKITNPMNDKSTYCVVNDRGPFKPMREIDLSYAAAKVLDMITLGQCMVKIEFLGIDYGYMQAVKDLFARGD